MKITYALLRGFKRFHNSRISEIEASFESPVQIILGSNGSGKSTYIKELSPLPSIRSDYEPGGLKELHIEHNNHHYVLKTDFTNKVSPHSFTLDGVELNEGHTSQIQEELAIKHFAFTPAIRNLIYGKVAVCSMTPVNRKNMFLAINPMDLSLILNTYKLALQHFKDCKAQMQLLYTRKGNLEAKMLKPEILAQNVETKNRLENWSLEIDKILFALKQHINSISERFKDELSYKSQCDLNHQELIPKEQMLTQCKEIVRKSIAFTHVPRGSEFSGAKERIHSELHAVEIKIDNVKKHIEDLASEINEYQNQLDKAGGERKASDVEKEILEIDKELEKYKVLPTRPIPSYAISSYQTKAENIHEILFTIEKFDFKIRPRSELKLDFDNLNDLTNTLKRIQERIGTLTSEITEQKTELDNHKQKASIPADCNFTACGLRILFDRRYKSVEDKYNSNVALLDKLQKDAQEYTAKIDKLTKSLEPYAVNQVVLLLEKLEYALQDEQLKFHDWSTELIDILNTHPLSIYKEITDLIEGSKLYYQAEILKNKKMKLETELKTIMSSTGASINFLEKKIKEKTDLSKTEMSNLTKLSNKHQKLDAQCALYLDYASTCDTLEEMERIYSRGERALLVSKAIEYWKRLGQYLFDCKKKINEELRDLETLVKDQEIIKHTYESETITLIDKIAHEKLIHEKICDALNPNTGIAFKSMVKYLNSIITNVNYFISQLWNFKLELPTLTLDQALDYNFKIRIGSDTAGDLSHLSDGQTEVVNFAWELAILLQMKTLNNIPLYADELGRAMDVTHRQKLLDFLKQLVDNKLVNQMFLINHYAALSDGFTNSDIIALDTTNLPDLPKEINQHVKIVRY